MAKIHNGANGGTRFTRAGLTYKQELALTDIKQGWVITNLNSRGYSLSTIKALFNLGMINLEIDGKNWTASKAGA